MAKANSAGKKAMFREAQYKQAKGIKNHTILKNKVSGGKQDDLRAEYEKKPAKPKGKKKPGSGKSNRPF
jgi:hypothetical protein